MMVKNIFNNWKALWHPERFHGWGRRRSYFEGWYFKIVDPTNYWAFAFIPGISFDDTGRGEAFIQTMDGTNGQSSFLSFKDEVFLAHPGKFEIAIGNSIFSGNRLSLDLEHFTGDLEFVDHVSWPKSFGAPGIMGWYSFVPFMQCNHGIVSMDHNIRGQLNYKGLDICFDGGKGYIEKDWGSSFPQCWIWMQSNGFRDNEAVSVVASVAHIPWLGSYFVGFIVGFLYRGEVHRFATYTGAKMRSRIEDGLVILEFRDKKKQLILKAHQAEGVELISPIKGKMTGKLNESLKAEIQATFAVDNKIVYRANGSNAGLEIAGDVSILLTD